MRIPASACCRSATSRPAPERVSAKRACSARVADLYHESMRIACPACAAEYERAGGSPAAGQGGPLCPMRRGLGAGRQGAASHRRPGKSSPRRAVSRQPRRGPRLPCRRQSLHRPGASELHRTREPAVAAARRVAIAWVLSIAVLGAAAWGAYARRGDVVRVWPPSERAYLALGIPVRLADAVSSS